MLDTDTLLMKRALELARRGAGLASPNPLVGALLINDGRVVGEGYHLYESVRHAESYAIEAAGALAKGATLYCNLEPCCHQGRTPPCTDALIKAKIARAVVAVKDPNPNVNGRGLERLREAGIEVEVGVLEERALRLNESYFKYITRGEPFLHAVIEYPAGATALVTQWRPSKEFLQTISECDAVMMGDGHVLNMLVLEEGRGRTRHRPLVVVASNPRAQLLKFLERLDVSVLHLEGESGSDAAKEDAERKVVNMDEGPAHGVLRSQIEVAKATLARMNVTSLVILPGALELSDPSNFEELDKATLVVPGSSTEQQHALHWTLGDIEFDFDSVSVTEVEGFAELTGYPSSREVA
jgi:diaminohydroxyphosphoribosylaminopyrimidine deaminase/5-amino-6-(5-phosphoribosylamino)uracil reductase